MAERTATVIEALGALEGLRVHDVSPTIRDELPVFFVYERPEIAPLFRHSEESGGAAANELRMAEHTGAHVDAPFHFDPDGPTMDRVPIESLLLKPYKKYDLSDKEPGPGDLIGLEQLKAAEARGGFELEAGDVAIVETGWDRYLPDGPDARDPDWWGRNQPGLSDEACEYIADSKVVAVASDTAACDLACKDGEIVAGHGHESHFLPRGILIVESLQGLAEAPATGIFLALPLKIEGGTGSPLRVVLLTE
jgi:kynurenine formamidase